ncbi:GNAT family N-acetyltransferase [Flexithrix dorotheae]|uniref:GNAT family N-acetyltransferase n=1 Tax=Flexithrix dorotheae TaxID=70993 RepID=UPI00037C44A8|nr:GNAT family N-acetyltransferase [Flexithrix dorotheae]
MKPTLENINIRTNYKAGDIGYLTYMHGRFYDFDSSFEFYVAETLAAFYKNMDPEKERFWVAENEEKIVGTIALKNTDNFAQLRYFLIDPEFRGIGLGKKLMDLFMEFFRQSNYKSSFLLTEARLQTAAHIYGKYGYQYVSSNQTDFGLVEKRYELVLP